MNHSIWIREANSARDIDRFWAQLRAYFARDVFPDPESEERAYFLDGPEYPASIQRLHERAENRLRYLFFVRDGIEIGFAMAAVFDSEDGKCFLMEFCVYPEFRGGAGTACANALLDWSKAAGAKYWELTCSNERRIRFWTRLGFVPNGLDEWGEPLMLKRGEESPVAIANAAEDWQLRRLENGFLHEIGEEKMDDARFGRLLSAMRDRRIQFFFAKTGMQTVGMASVVRSFSTFPCADVGVFDDFYVLPAFRGQGIARMLVRAARNWCAANGLACLNVCCAPCDEAMYSSLGFGARLGIGLSMETAE